MPFIPAHELRPAYWMVSYDEAGVELHEAEGGLVSDQLMAELSTGNFTDVVVMAHGWNGDVSAARRQFDAWSTAAARQEADIAAIRARRRFEPLLIGVHWPSLAFGDESTGGTAFALTASEPFIDSWAKRLVDTPETRQALAVLLAEAETNIDPTTLPETVVAAYRTLYAETGLAAGGSGAAPGNDHAGFNPEDIYQESRDIEDGLATSFGEPIAAGLLAPLRVLSFWTMKARARTVGEGGAHTLLKRMQTVGGLRFHLMGHSFGCIVASAMINGPTADPAPVNTVFLCQGALSLWSFCANIPPRPGLAGYFHRLRRERLVSGAMVTTLSRHDIACRVFYPLGAGLAGQVDFDTPGRLPEFGALGTFGAQGDGVAAQSRPMGGVTTDYDFVSGSVTNLEATDWIRHGLPPAGAHNDIARPEVAHAFWQALMAE